MDTTGATLDRTAPPRALVQDLAYAAVVMARATAALAVGLAASIGGTYLYGATASPADSLSAFDPRRLAVSLFVLGIAVAALVTGRSSGRRRSGVDGFLVAAAGSLLTCVPLLALRLSDGSIVSATQGVGFFPGTTTTNAIRITLTLAAGLGLATGGVLTAAPARSRHAPGSALAVGSRLLLPAGFAVGLVTRAAVNPEWQTTLTMIATVATVATTILVYWYGRRTALTDAAAGRDLPAPGAAGPWWRHPAVALFALVILVLVAQIAVVNHFTASVEMVEGDISNLSTSRTGLAVLTAVAVLAACLAAAYVAGRWGSGAIRVIGVALGSGFALGSQMIALNYPAKRVTFLVAVCAAIVAVLLVAAAGSVWRRVPEVPWDMVGLLVAATGAAVTLWQGPPGGAFSSPLRIEVIVAGVAVAFIGSVPVMARLSGPAPGMLVAFAALLFFAAAQLATAYGEALFIYDPSGAPLPTAYRIQLWVPGLVPLALALLAGGAAWAVRPGRCGCARRAVCPIR